jgi:hypothetical protein
MGLTSSRPAQGKLWCRPRTSPRVSSGFRMPKPCEKGLLCAEDREANGALMGFFTASQNDHRPRHRHLMICCGYAGLCILLLAWGTVCAQADCPTSPPAYGLLRQDEDYRYLGNPACRDDYWDRLKYVRLGSNQDTFLTLGGAIREWYENFHNASWGSGPQDDMATSYSG